MRSISEKLIKIEEILDLSMPSHVSSQWVNWMAGSEVAGNLDLEDVDSFVLPGLELLKRGGKRWRPLLLVLCCEAAGGGDNGYPLTPLVEVPHNGSLIVDDIEDRSEERRGGPAIHMMFGSDVAINTGNLMYFMATALIEDLDWDPQKKHRLYKGYLEDMRRLHLGQGLDIRWHNQSSRIPKIDAYLQMCRFKTGSLSRMAARLGTLAADKEESFTLRAAEIWETAGVGFQILDDVKNLTTGNPGKQRGDDIVEGKKGLPIILFGQENEDQIKILQPLLEESVRLGFPEATGAVEKAIDILNTSGSISEAREIGQTMLKNAKTEIQELFKDSPACTQQLDMIDSFISKMT